MTSPWNTTEDRRHWWRLITSCCLELGRDMVGAKMAKPGLCSPTTHPPNVQHRLPTSSSSQRCEERCPYLIWFRDCCTSRIPVIDHTARACGMAPDNMKMLVCMIPNIGTSVFHVLDTDLPSGCGPRVDGSYPVSSSHIPLTMDVVCKNV